MRHSILPEGEHVKRAIRWISESRRDGVELTSFELVNEAALRFDLSPLEEEWLLRTFGDIERENARASEKTV